MYCIQCGVKLSDSEKVCPLCGTVPYHPDIKQNTGESTYAKDRKAKPAMNRYAVMVLIAVAYVITVIQLIGCNLLVSNEISWSFYAAGAVVLSYILFILPLWFKKPNPVIFVPCDFLAIEAYLCGINAMTGGDWFLSLAFPCVGIFGIIVTVVVTLSYYIRRGYFFIYGGAVIACGVFIALLELFVYLTFDLVKYYFWSVYPMSACVLLGLALIVIGICPGLRVKLEKKFFI